MALSCLLRIQGARQHLSVNLFSIAALKDRHKGLQIWANVITSLRFLPMHVLLFLWPPYYNPYIDPIGCLKVEMRLGWVPKTFGGLPRSTVVSGIVPWPLLLIGVPSGLPSGGALSRFVYHFRYNWARLGLTGPWVSSLAAISANWCRAT